MAEATREVVATYRRPAEARSAIKMLERHGIDAERIRMIGTPGLRDARTDAVPNPDMTVTRKVGARGFATAIVVAVVAFVVVYVLSRFVLDAAAGASMTFAVGAFVAGGALGFFYGGATALAVSDEWGESFAAHGPATIAVHVPDDAVVDLRERLASTNPQHLTVA